MIIVYLGLAVIVAFVVLKIVTFNETTYHKNTGNSFIATFFDKGRNGEYQIFNYLKKYESKGSKFLFNVYLPKDDGETTEADVIMITPKGVIVFESKNYSGWIFGDEKYKSWTQTLPSGKGKSKKEHFFNPIMQNNLHIKYLKKLIGEDYPFYSLIVFSERCTLKKITVHSENVQVIKRNNVCSAVSKIMSSKERDILSKNDIDNIYDTLYTYSQADDETKQKHINNIQQKHK